MKQRHEEIRQKYGEPSDYYELNWQGDARVLRCFFFVAVFYFFMPINTFHVFCNR